MNCNPGDLAVVIGLPGEEDPIYRKLIKSILVSVVLVVCINKKGDINEKSWVISDPILSQFTSTTGTTFHISISAIEDAFLQPIHGGTKTDVRIKEVV